MNTRESRKSFHYGYDNAIIITKALIRVICEPHLLDVGPIQSERIFVRQDDPAFVGGSAGRPDALLDQYQPMRNMEPQS
jgi:hypothetical protein